MIRSILGPNTFAAKQQLNDLLKSVNPSSIERFEGVDVELDKLSTTLQARSLFDNPTVILSDVSDQKSIHEDVIKLIENTYSETELIVYEPNIDRRSKYYKFLKNNTDSTEHDNPDPNELIAWVVHYSKSLDSEIDRSSARFLIERIGEDQWLLSNELKKLSLAEGKVDRATIEEMVEPTPKESIFALLDSVLSGNERKVAEEYDDLISQKLEPNYILSMLAWQLHIASVLVFSEGKNSDQVAKDASISPFVAKKTSSLTKKISKSK